MDITDRVSVYSYITFPVLQCPETGLKMFHNFSLLTSEGKFMSNINENCNSLITSRKVEAAGRELRLVIEIINAEAIGPRY